MSREDWVVVGLDEEDVIEGEEKYRHIRIGSVKV
jgi:hypothetical protein